MEALRMSRIRCSLSIGFRGNDSNISGDVVTSRVKCSEGIARVSALFVLVVAGSLLWPALGLAQTVNVDGSVQYQKIDGFGFSAAFGRAYTLETRCPADQQGCPEQQRILDLLFNPQTGAGLTILRNIAPSDQFHTIEPPPGPGAPWLPPNYTWDHNSWGQVWLAQQAQRYGVQKFYLDAWSAPGFMKTNNFNYNPTIDDKNGGSLCGAPGTSCPADWKQAYANYLVQYLRDYQSDGINITHLGAFNEPTVAANYSSMQMSSGQAANFMELLGQTANTAGFSPQIVCCDSASWDGVQPYLNALDGDPNASPRVNVISGHTYGGDHEGITGGGLLTGTFDRPVWMSEWGARDGWNPDWDSSSKGAGIWVAYTMQFDLTNTNLSAYLYWWGVGFDADSSSNCDCILIQDVGGSITPAKRLWAMAQFSRYIHPGATRISANSSDSNLMTSAFLNSDGTIAVVALNLGSSPVFSVFSLQNVGAAVHGVAAPYITDSFNDIAPQDAIPLLGGAFNATIPARALVTYVITPGEELEPNITATPAAAMNADGRLEVFGRAVDGGAWHNWQTSAGGNWSGWFPLGGSILNSPSASMNADGRLEIFAQGTDQGAYHNYQTTAGGNWSGWLPLGGGITNTPSVAMNADGRLEIFAEGLDQGAYHNWQTSAGGDWFGWLPLGGGITNTPSVAMNADGRLEIFAEGLDQGAYHNWQTSAGGNWFGWLPMGGGIANSPSVAVNTDGRLEIFAKGPDQSAYHNWQNWAGGDWSGWYPLGGIITDTPSVAVDGNGLLEIFAEGADQGGWFNVQGWSGWYPLGGIITGSPSVVENVDGRLEVFAVGADSHVYHNAQTSPGGSWSGWGLL
jgi:O-glycosyl hydrolase